MPVINRIAEFHTAMMAWRRDIHAHPEMAFNERRTSDFVATELEKLGIEIHRGLAGTGVVGTLRGGNSSRAIALRADMDALPIQEKTGCSHASTHDGIMHACGHDGHTTMLLGAARYLAETRNIDREVREESESDNELAAAVRRLGGVGWLASYAGVTISAGVGGSGRPE